MGKVLGCKVIALAGSEDKCQLALKNWAAFAINYNKDNMVSKIKEFTQGRGFDVMLD